MDENNWWVVIDVQIAIDGPAGAGKSTVAKALAQKLGFVYIDTGAMYRALTWSALNNGIALEDPVSLAQLASSLNIYFTSDFDSQRLICNGSDLTDLIRTPEINSSVSLVAVHPLVRAIMVKKQQQMAATTNVVMDGRDIGELVLPEADYKFFLTAGIKERAHRRSLELELRGYYQGPEIIMRDIELRDRLDSERKVGALKILPDSIVIDTSDRTAAEVLAQILAIVLEDQECSTHF
jgi:cytidylate kinase